MRKMYSYQKISQLYRRFQFHISGFILAAVGVWLFWEVGRHATLPDWLFYLFGIWALGLAIELFRFYYVFRSRRKNKQT